MENKSYFGEPKRFTREQISFFFISVTLFLGFSAFWNFQSKIWNRVVYTIGEWQYPIPFYPKSEYPDPEFISELVNNTILSLFVNVIFFIAILNFLYNSIKTNKGPRSIGVTLVLVVVMFIVNFWNYRAVLITPNDWLPIALSELGAQQWKFSGISLPFAETKLDFFKTIFIICIILTSTLLIVAVSLLFYSYLMIRERSNNPSNPALQTTTSSTTLSDQSITKENDTDVRVTTSQKSINIGGNLKSFAFYSIMIAFLIYTVTPVFYTFLLSMSNQSDFINDRIFPEEPINNFIRNYSSVIFIQNGDRAPSFGRSFVISLILGFGTSIGGLFISLPAAYSISRFKFKGRGATQFLVLATQMFPGIILLLPQFFFWVRLGLLDRDAPNRVIFGVLLAYFVGALAYNIWMMKGYFDTLPYDLEEAALIDGASVFGSFLKIAVPLAAPGMVAVGIFTFLGAWNEFALAQIFIGESSKNASLPLLFYQYQDTSAPDNPVYFELLSAFSILAALPIVIVFMGLQRFLTSGLTQGGVKGI